MNTYEQLSEASRVWIYQSNRPFTSEEVRQLRPALAEFAAQWVSHSQQLKAYADVFHDQFIVLMVDESMAGASGCSIDSSVRFIKQIEASLQVNLFDRMTFTYKEGDEVKTAPRELFSKLYNEGIINDETLVFDTLVNSKKSFEDSWIKQLGNSWHKRMV